MSEVEQLVRSDAVVRRLVVAGVARDVEAVPMRQLVAANTHDLGLLQFRAVEEGVVRQRIRLLAEVAVVLHMHRQLDDDPASLFVRHDRGAAEARRAERKHLHPGAGLALLQMVLRRLTDDHLVLVLGEVGGVLHQHEGDAAVHRAVRRSCIGPHAIAFRRRLGCYP